MVKLLYTALAHVTMLRPGRFLKLACGALVLLLKHDPVRFESLNSHQVLSWFNILIKTSWIDPACHEVACVAHEHEDSAGILVVAIDILIWHFRKSFIYIDVEPSKRAHKVDNLYEWVRFETDPVS